MKSFVTLACLLAHVYAQDSADAVQTATAIAAEPTETLPTQVQVPPKQAWCPSDIFCAGPLLQTLNLAELYPDDKTYVDKPTSKNASEVIADFNKFNLSTVTQEQLAQFVNTDFAGEGLELEALTIPNFNPNPAFLGNVTGAVTKAFSQTVNSFWGQLIRGTNDSTLCGGANDCESTLIPLNHTFVVPGGRFREQYYWDSFWILEGLLESELYDVAKGTLENFLDELDQFGFIPNGGRIYYLNRSQPPVFIQMLHRYVNVTGDTSILERGLPLAEKELTWWNTNRLVNVTSPFTNETHGLYHYSVTNSAPRPESYGTDYLTANDPALRTPLNETQRADLYAELASGAESGWDYTVRWYSNPFKNDGLRSLNVRNTIAVDLNSILYRDHVLLADLYGSTNADATTRHEAAAAALKTGILDLFWDSAKVAFYDYNLATGSRNDIFTAAAFYPFWSGIVPDEVANSTEKAFAAFSSVHLVLNRYNGTFPSTFIDTGLQWDAPNTWPPHQYIILQALKSLPSTVAGGAAPQPADGQSTFNLVPAGQLGLDETQLPGQTIHAGGSVSNATKTGAAADINRLNGTVVNGGNATDGEGWAAALQRELANRYFSSAFCSWHATGGSIPDLVPRLPNDELVFTNSVNSSGHMFEKFSNLDIDSAGYGGEYTVQAGFGWTNGVLLWVASNYGGKLNDPQCPNLVESATTGSDNGASAVSVSSTLVLIALGVTVLFVL